MPAYQSPLPRLWLLSDARNDGVLELVLRSLGQPAGLVFRHYHLPDAQRIARYRQLRRIARQLGHLVILSGDMRTARRWQADGVYGPPTKLARPASALLKIATAHSMAEIGQAGRIGADAIMLSPVFPTRSHPGGATLGPLRFLTMARTAPMPVIALGGMNPRNAKRLVWPRWAAIDGLSGTRSHTDS